MNNQAVEICCIVKAYIYCTYMYADKVVYMEKKNVSPLHLLNGIASMNILQNVFFCVPQK